MQPKHNKLRAVAGMVCVALATACLAAFPLGVFAVADAARFQAAQPVQQTYEPIQPSADDFYLLRLLKSREQVRRNGFRDADELSNAPSFYLASASARESMTQNPAAAAYALTVLESLKNSGVVPADWADSVLQKAKELTENHYTSADTLGFVTMTCFLDGMSALEFSSLYSITMDGKTGAVVSLFLTDTTAHDAPDKSVILPAFIAQAGLSALQDWAPPTGTSYAESGLYSARGTALATCATGGYNLNFQSSLQASSRYYYSMLLSTTELNTVPQN